MATTATAGEEKGRGPGPATPPSKSRRRSALITWPAPVGRGGSDRAHDLMMRGRWPRACCVASERNEQWGKKPEMTAKCHVKLAKMPGARARIVTDRRCRAEPRQGRVRTGHGSPPCVPNHSCACSLVLLVPLLVLGRSTRYAAERPSSGKAQRTCTRPPGGRSRGTSRRVNWPAKGRAVTGARVERPRSRVASPCYLL